MFYKHFFALDRPLVFCEGKTDNIYLKCALRQLKNEYTNLVHKKADGLEFKVNFFNFSPTASKVLALAEGSSGQVALVNTYPKQIDRFKGAGMKHPVIMLFDNDNGAAGIKGLMKSKYKIKDTAQQFYHLAKNLYVVFTPGENSTIEDFFEKVVLEIKIGNKSFHPDPDISSQYGKSVFASRVVSVNQNKINFDGFKPLLDRLQAAVSHYTTPRV